MTKRCPRCGVVKPAEEFGWREYANGRRNLRAYCGPCQREVGTAWARKKRKRDGEKIRARQREYVARMWADPERRELLLEGQRFRYRRKHARVKAPPKAGKNGHHYDPTPATPNQFGPMLAAWPLAEWLRREFYGWEKTEVARVLHVHERTVARLLSGEQKRISLHMADRMFVAARCPHLLALLYPLGAEPPLPKYDREGVAA